MPWSGHGIVMSDIVKNKAPVVGLFVTCLVDTLRPGVGFASARLLQRAGCQVEVPLSQTCCGQPAYNAGDQADTKAIAKNVITSFEGYDYLVAPSGSCAGMIKEHYPKILKTEKKWKHRAEALAARTFELTQFLSAEVSITALESEVKITATYHDACSGLRELKIKKQPRELLLKVPGISLRESKKAERCCGFGGLFCVKYSDISTGMVDEKIADLEATGAEAVLGGDLGCLLNIAGRLKRVGSRMEVRHIAEVLAGPLDMPAILEAQKIKR